jgi:hypothetical protein
MTIQNAVHCIVTCCNTVGGYQPLYDYTVMWLHCQPVHCILNSGIFLPVLWPVFVFLHPTCEVLSKVLSCLFSGSPCKRSGGNPCKNNGRCEEDTLGNFHCFCEGRYTGTAPVLYIGKWARFMHRESSGGLGWNSGQCMWDLCSRLWWEHTRTLRDQMLLKYYEGGPRNNRNLNVACELEVVARHI